MHPPAYLGLNKLEIQILNRISNNGGLPAHILASKDCEERPHPRSSQADAPHSSASLRAVEFLSSLPSLLEETRTVCFGGWALGCQHREVRTGRGWDEAWRCAPPRYVLAIGGDRLPAAGQQQQNKNHAGNQQNSCGTRVRGYRPDVSFTLYHSTSQP